MRDHAKTALWFIAFAVLALILSHTLTGCASNCPRGHFTCGFN